MRRSVVFLFTLFAFALAVSSPLARKGHGSCVVQYNGKPAVVVWGGLNKQQKQFLNDLWILTFDGDKNSWVRGNASSPIPSGRWKTCMETITGRGAVMMGGSIDSLSAALEEFAEEPHHEWQYLRTVSSASSGLQLKKTLVNFLNDTWVYDSATDSWTELAVTGHVDGVRTQSCMNFNGDMLVFAGKTAAGNSDTLYNFTKNNEWIKLPNPPSKLYKRRGQVAVTDGVGKMYVFGGRESLTAYYNDLWEYDSATQTWKELESQTRPPARDHHMAVFWNGNIIMYGGRGGLKSSSSTKHVTFGDMWAWNVKDKKWTEIKVSSNSPLPLPRFLATLVVVQDRLVLFGGQLDAGMLTDAVWTYDLRLNVWEGKETVWPYPSHDKHRLSWKALVGIAFGCLGGLSICLLALIRFRKWKEAREDAYYLSMDHEQ